MIEDSHTEFGHEEEMVHRWKRVVRQLDRYSPGWRKNAAFMGDAAMQAIANLAIGAKPAPAKANAFYVVRQAMELQWPPHRSDQGFVSLEELTAAQAAKVQP